tara:strand:+ start:1801 stop:2193 length:393 start_codon:yes stop_codon:yes gene_type:complete
MICRSFKIVCVSGFFDPIHVGHIDYFKNAKLLGDKLIVILNKDCQRKKKPMFNEEQRKILLESIRYVDQVIFAEDDDKTVCQTLKKIKPDIFAKGCDASENETKVCEEENIEIVRGVGGNIHLQDILYDL